MDIKEKYRPKRWEDVLGNEVVTKSLQFHITNPERPHVIMFVGERGTGKTTLAKLYAQELGIDEIEYINNAKENGVDFARNLGTRIAYRGFGKAKMYILDECQRLTPDAQEIMLTDNILENTHEHAYIVMCTTDPQKLKDAFLSRATIYEVKKPDRRELLSRLMTICETEGIPADKTTLSKLVTVKQGIPRDSIGALDNLRGLSLEQMDKAVIEMKQGDTEAVGLAQALMKSDWNLIRKSIRGLKQNPTSATIAVREYMAGVLLNGENSTAFNTLLAFDNLTVGSDKMNLVKACYEAYVRNKGGR